jgi:hypothetical protein
MYYYVHTNIYTTYMLPSNNLFLYIYLNESLTFLIDILKDGLYELLVYGLLRWKLGFLMKYY